MADPATARARRVVEVALYAPFGLFGYLRDAAPTLLTVLVARGRGEVDRARSDIARQVRHVRSYGDAMIAFGLKRGGAASDAVDAEASLRNRVGAATSPGTTESGAARSDDAAGEPRGDDTRSASLAIPAYDSLSASQVVERLTGLDPTQLDAVRSYEEDTRRRRTILGKIDQLTA